MTTVDTICWPKASANRRRPLPPSAWTLNHAVLPGMFETLCGLHVEDGAMVVPPQHGAVECKKCQAKLKTEEQTGVVECCWCGGECDEGEFWTKNGSEVFCCKAHRDASVRALKRFRESAAMARTFTGPPPSEEISMSELSAEQTLARADLDRVLMDSLTAEREHHLIVTTEHKGTPVVPTEMRRHIARMDGAIRALYGKLPRFIIYRREGEHDGGGPRYWAVGEAVPFDARPETACAIVASQDGINVGDELHAKLGDWGD